MNRAVRSALEVLADIEAGRKVTPERAAAIKAQLAPWRPRKFQFGPTRKQDSSKKSEVHRASTKEIRAAVMVRANFRCEVIHSGGRCALPAISMDHWLGGAGRRRQQQKVETCWALCATHDYQRTHNVPSAAVWNERRRRHCDVHGHGFQPHIEHARLTR